MDVPVQILHGRLHVAALQMSMTAETLPNHSQDNNSTRKDITAKGEIGDCTAPVEYYNWGKLTI